MKSLFLILLAVPVGLLHAGEKSIHTWDDLAREIRANNPDLQAADASTSALRQRIPQAAAWDDPTASTSLERHSAADTFDYAGAELTLSQKIPLSGRNLIAARIARAEASAAGHTAHHLRYDLLDQAAEAWFQLYALDRQLDLLQKKAALLQLSAQSATAALGTGQDNALASLDFLAQSADLTAQQAELTARRAEIVLGLNQLMNRPSASAIDAPEELRFTPLKTSSADLLALARANHPEITGALFRLQAARQRLTATRRAWIPDPEISLTARHLDGSGQGLSEYNAGVSISLPWLNAKKYRAASAEAQAEVAQAEAEVTSIRRKTDTAILTRVEQIQARQTRYLTLQDRLLPLAEKSVAASEAAYGAGRLPLADALQARLALLTLRGQLADALAAHQTALLQLQIETSP